MKFPRKRIPKNQGGGGGKSKHARKHLQVGVWMYLFRGWFGIVLLTYGGVLYIIVISYEVTMLDYVFLLFSLHSYALYFTFGGALSCLSNNVCSFARCASLSGK